MQEIDVNSLFSSINDMYTKTRRGEAAKPVKLSEHVKKHEK